MTQLYLGGFMNKRKSPGFYPITIVVIALALIWVVGHGEAGEARLSAQDLFVVDTVDLRQTDTESDADYYSGEAADKPKTISHYTRLLATMAYKIHNNYMEPLDAEEIARTAIDGMLDNLDPFSVVMDMRSYGDLMEKTQGKYEGLGIIISKRGDYITVISPFEGTPAWNLGIQAGDKIVKIEGQDTKNMTSEEATELMRGSAGTAINITIKRPGIDDPLDYNIMRAVIELKSVNYAGIVNGDVGYVRLSKFSETSTDELKAAIDSLSNETDLSGLILDLRSNGGGLLSQAVDVANLFLDNGDLIVSTRGHTPASQRDYTARYEPIFKDKPLVVLVDGGTASASEIVSGAIQDWDRGIIIGNTTFGKGLVQQIFTTSDPDFALKLTTAKYYIPSGRCIQRPERSTKHPEQLSEEDIELDTAQAETPDESELYLTKGGRPVYGGGGVVPDIEIERDTWQPIEINLERQSIFFDFAVKYTSDHPDVGRDIEVDDHVFQIFKDFCKEKDFAYKSKLQTKLEELEETIEEQDKTAMFKQDIDDMKRLVEVEKQNDFENSKDWIMRSIKREIIRKMYGESGVYEEMVLKTDKYVQKALEVLKEKNAYGKILEPKEKTDS